MARSLNKVTLIGNLTRDPELKYTPSGTAVCTFGIATNRSWTTKSGETKEDVQFHRIVCWQKLAELVDQLLSKGRKVYLEGRITYKQFEGKDGNQKNMTEIVMSDFVLFDDRYKGGSSDSDEDSSSGPDKDDDDVPTEEPDESDTNGDDDESVDPSDIPF